MTATSPCWIVHPMYTVVSRMVSFCLPAICEFDASEFETPRPFENHDPPFINSQLPFNNSQLLFDNSQPPFNNSQPPFDNSQPPVNNIQSPFDNSKPPIFWSASMLVFVFSTAVLIVGILWEHLMWRKFENSAYLYISLGGRRLTGQIAGLWLTYKARVGDIWASNTEVHLFCDTFIRYLLIFRERRSHASCSLGGRRYSIWHTRIRNCASTPLHSTAAGQSTATILTNELMYVTSEIHLWISADDLASSSRQVDVHSVLSNVYWTARGGEDYNLAIPSVLVISAGNWTSDSHFTEVLFLWVEPQPNATGRR